MVTPVQERTISHRDRDQAPEWAHRASSCVDAAIQRGAVTSADLRVGAVISGRLTFVPLVKAADLGEGYDSTGFCYPTERNSGVSFSG